MKAVILCGGQGTRIRDANELLPKPMLHIGGRPIVWHIMKIYEQAGIRDFILCLGYKGWLFKEYFLNYDAMTSDITVHLGNGRGAELAGRPRREDWNVTLVDTGERTETAGRIAAVRRHLDSDELFAVTYGDGVADIDIQRLVEFHRGQGTVATITAVRPPSRFGEIRVDAARVIEFNEKPQATAGLINGGFFLFDGRRIWDYLGDDPSTLLEREPLQRLARSGELAAFEHPGFWQPMDTLREYNLLNRLWDEDRAPWKLW